MSAAKASPVIAQGSKANWQYMLTIASPFLKAAIYRTLSISSSIWPPAGLRFFRPLKLRFDPEEWPSVESGAGYFVRHNLNIVRAFASTLPNAQRPLLLITVNKKL